MFPNSILVENLPQYIFTCLIFPYKISDLSNVRFERYIQTRKIGQQTF
jgi:hypothetical protein